MDTVVIIKLKEFRRIRREFLESDQIAHLLYGEFNEYSESFDTLGPKRCGSPRPPNIVVTTTLQQE